METTMSGLGDKLKGKVNEGTGGAKQEIGQQTGDANLTAEGTADEAKGKGQGAVGAAKDAVADLKDKATH